MDPSSAASGGNAGLRAPLAPGSRVYVEFPGYPNGPMGFSWWGGTVYDIEGSDLSIVFDNGDLYDIEEREV